ncbi:hypothetical protein TYRP_011689 [Tyrophagus putrescentiae]|nr:hypothetical protein TYRP_011689 [Tyrophagus putrescentiae]
MLRLSKLLAAEVIKPAVKELGVTFARSSVPVTDYHQYYRRYFVLCRRVRREQDRSVRRRFALYYLLLAYMALLNVAGYFLHHSVSPLVKVVLVDAIFVSGDHVHTYLAYNVMFAYTAVLQWQLFFRCSLPFNAILEGALFGAAGRRLDFSLRRQGGTTKEDGRRGGGKVPFQKLAPVVTNAMQTFILLTHLLILNFLVHFFAKLTTSFSLQWAAVTSDHHPLPAAAANFANWTLLLLVGVRYLLLLLLLLPVLLVHLSLFLLMWYSLAQALCFTGTFALVTILYLVASFRENYAQLKGAFGRYHHHHHHHHHHDHRRMLLRQHRRSAWLLAEALRRNLAHFEALFTSDQMLGSFFTVYLAVHVPMSTFYLVQLLFGDPVKGVLAMYSSVVRSTVLAILIETAAGALVIHLAAAYIANFVHRGGRMLLSFIAATTISTTTTTSSSSSSSSSHHPHLYQHSTLPVRLKLTIYNVHICQLVVKSGKNKLLILQTRPVFKEVATLLYRFTVPYKDLEHYRRYFATCRRVKLEKDPSIFCRFVLYILALTYMALLNSGGYFFQQKVSPLAHIVLVDVVFVAESNDHAYLACIIVIAYTMILQWQLYFSFLSSWRTPSSLSFSAFSAPKPFPLWPPGMMLLSFTANSASHHHSSTLPARLQLSVYSTHICRLVVRSGRKYGFTYGVQSSSSSSHHYFLPPFVTWSAATSLDLVTYFDPLVVVAVVEHPQSARLSPPPAAAKDPFQTPSISQQSWNFVYLFPLLFKLASLLYGNLLLVYLEEGELSLETLQRSPVALMHQSMPPDMWSQVDVIYYLAVATILMNYFTFFRRPYTGRRYEVMRVLKDDRTSSILAPSVSDAILASHRRFARWFSVVFFVFFPIGLFFCYFFCNNF